MRSSLLPCTDIIFTWFEIDGVVELLTIIEWRHNHDTQSRRFNVSSCFFALHTYIRLYSFSFACYLNESGRKTFPIGVAKYLTWPSTPWYTRFTCTHHLWTIPVFLRAYLHSSHHDRQMMSGNVMLRCFTLSCVIVTTHVVLSRWLTPFSIEIIGNGKDSDGDTQADRHHYLNINLSHELWKDITFSFLQISKDAPSPRVYIFRLLWRWWLFNGLVFYGLILPIFNWFSSIIMK